MDSALCALQSPRRHIRLYLMKKETCLRKSEFGGISKETDRNKAVAECLKSWRREGGSATPAWSIGRTHFQMDAFARWTMDVHNRITLEECFEELPERQQFILHEYICMGYTQVEIGQMLGISQEAVRYNLKAAMDKLARLIA